MSDEEDQDSLDEMNIGHYEGERDDNEKRHGMGKAYFPNGDVYEGMYANGMRHGKGSYDFSGGASYTGDYMLNQRHGFGTMIYPDGSKYEGNWDENTRHGTGTYNYINEDVYTGEWVKDVKSGKGTYTNTTTGTSRDGKGRFIFPNEKVQLLGKHTIVEKISEEEEDEEAKPVKESVWTTWYLKPIDT